jgi:two-component system response regulator YesN
VPNTDVVIKRNKDTFGLIGEMRRLYRGVVNANVTKSHSNMKLVLKKAMDFLERNYNKPLTLRQVADAVYVSPFYISRMFTRQLGKTMTDYLNGIRIRHACELLADVEYKVYQVGEMVGIPDAHYFSRIFKKHVGVTPTEYRNNVSGVAD